MDVVRASDRVTKRAPAENFTGDVWSDEVVTGNAPSRLRAGIVSFSPGARTAWHQHPVGQTLYCLSGIGRYQRKGQPVQELRAGDIVVIPPDVLHWHGASPDRIFSHMAISEVTDAGAGTAWFEHVSEEDYRARPAAAA